MSGGISMGSMGEGGGQNFYMGDGGQGQQQDEEYEYKNPELVVLDQAKENDLVQNRQYLEQLITGQEQNNGLFNPWAVNAPNRSKKTRREEKAEMNIPEAAKRNKLFIINA